MDVDVDRPRVAERVVAEDRASSCWRDSRRPVGASSARRTSNSENVRRRLGAVELRAPRVPSTEQRAELQDRAGRAAPCRMRRSTARTRLRSSATRPAWSRSRRRRPRARARRAASPSRAVRRPRGRRRPPRAGGGRPRPVGPRAEREVEEHQVERAPAARASSAACAVGRGDDAVAVGDERAGHDVAQLGVVLDDRSSPPGGPSRRSRSIERPTVVDRSARYAGAPHTTIPTRTRQVRATVRLATG